MSTRNGIQSRMGWSRFDYIVLVLRTVGMVLVSLGFFLYEDEEGRFQNKVEQWWVKISDVQKASRSKVAVFVQEVARLTGKGFDRLFGQPLFSLRVVPVSIYLSLASCFLLSWVMLPHVKHDPSVTRQGALGLLVYFLALALVPAVFKNRWILVLWWAIIPAALLSISGFLIFVLRTRGARSLFYAFGVVTLIFVSSLLCDLLYIALTRYILRRISRIDRISEILLMIVLNLMALTVPVLGPIYGGLALFKHFPRVGATVLFSVILNFIDFLAGFAAFALALILLVHRLFWPAIQRPLYAIYRFSPITEKKWLIRVGVTLLILPYHLSLEALKTIVEKALG
jgi:hypothetical protein